MGAESSLAAQPCARVVLLCLDPPFMGRPTSPFIDEGKVWVIAEEEEKNERERESEEGF